MISWNDGLDIGVKSIDDEHKKLLDIINKFSEAIDNDTNNEEFEKIFDKLNLYIREHFTSEEVLIKKSSYKDFDKHQYQHQFFTNKISEIKDRFFSTDDYSKRKEIVIFLIDWLINHIINEDMKLIKYFKESGLIEEDKNKKLSRKEKLLEFISTTVSFNKRMYISVIIPLIGMFLFASLFIWKNYQEYTSVKDVSRVTSSLFYINNLTHSLQIERGLSSGYISASNDEFYEKLSKQRKISNDTIKLLIDKLELEKKYFQKNVISKFIKDVESLEKIRLLIDSKKILKENEFNFYTKMIKNIFTMTSSIMFLHSSKKISYHLSILSSMISLKEIMGQERAYGMLIIEQGYSTWKQYNNFLKFQASQETYFHIFRGIVINRDESMMNDFLFSDINKQVSTYREQILNHEYNGLTLDKWFLTTTKNIENFNYYIDIHLNEISNIIKNDIDELFYNFIIWSIFTFIILMVTQLIIYLFEESNSSQILKLLNGMKSLASGNRNIKLLDNYDFKDNISEIYDSYELTRQALLKSDIHAQIYIEQEKIKVIYQEKLNEILKKEVNHDGLTGLYNRRYFDMIFTKELSRARRNKLSFTFVMMDIDYFKQYNDTYGHSEGDNVLKLIADFLDKKLSRAGDFCFRLGGEEFGFFFTGKSLEDAISYTEVICKGIEKLHIKHSKNLVSSYITASFGLIYFNDKSIDIDAHSLYIAADKVLYKAKEDGRNRVVVNDIKESFYD